MSAVQVLGGVGQWTLMTLSRKTHPEVNSIHTDCYFFFSYKVVIQSKFKFNLCCPSADLAFSCELNPGLLIPVLILVIQLIQLYLNHNQVLMVDGFNLATGENVPEAKHIVKYASHHGSPQEVEFRKIWLI